MALHFRQALLPTGWADDVRLDVTDGIITGVETGVAPPPGHRLLAALPGQVNLHSHAFQRAMAGLTERRGSDADSFWTWRQVMYEFVDGMTPQACRSVAELAYIEMLESGFTRVAEFHYLHHDQAGIPYADPAEMGAQIVEAARATGIDLTLLPVFYRHANFGGVAPTHGQRRFISDLDGFARLIEASEHHVGTLPQAGIGLAPHSLRAATPDQLTALVALAADRPIHMHIAEQPREVADSVAWSGARPVEWLLDNAPVGPRWCLIHATHMTEAETIGLARTGAVAGLCPLTEANLGDGTFAAASWLEQGGAIGVGTDSNVAIGMASELQQLEYSQRLLTGQRNVLATGSGSSAAAMVSRTLAGGHQAVARVANALAVGSAANIVTLDLSHPALAHRHDDAILDGWIFGRSGGAIASVYVDGVELVQDGRHVRRGEIERHYLTTLKQLLSG